MRAVFTIDLPELGAGNYPSNKQILDLVRTFGWERLDLLSRRVNGIEEIAAVLEESDKRVGALASVSAVHDASSLSVVPTDAALADSRSGQNAEMEEINRHKRYQELASVLFKDMPEVVANEEQQSVIFYGYLADEKTKFVITRMVSGQITFRLLHPSLTSLQSSTEKMVRKIIGSTVAAKPLVVSNERVEVLERGQEHVIVTGRVIPHALRETIRTDKRDAYLSIIPTLLLYPTIALGEFLGRTSITLQGHMERMSTALLTTALVSFLGLAQTYSDIRKNKIIAWSFAADSARQ